MIDSLILSSELFSEIARLKKAALKGLGPNRAQGYTLAMDHMTGVIRSKQKSAKYGHKLYTASKTKHAHLWKQLRDNQIPIVSTWIDEAEEGQTVDYGELAQRCVREVSEATAFVLYVESDDILKGALIELGVAMFLKLPVICMYTEPVSPSISRVWRKHHLWREVVVADSDEAFSTIYRAWCQHAIKELFDV